MFFWKLENLFEIIFDVVLDFVNPLEIFLWTLKKLRRILEDRYKGTDENEKNLGVELPENSSAGWGLLGGGFGKNRQSQDLPEVYYQTATSLCLVFPWPPPENLQNPPMSGGLSFCSNQWSVFRWLWPFPMLGGAPKKFGGAAITKWWPAGFPWPFVWLFPNSLMWCHSRNRTRPLFGLPPIWGCPV